MTIAFLLLLAILGFLMKAVVLLLPVRKGVHGWRFILSPVVAPGSLTRSGRPMRLGRLLANALVAVGGFALWYWVCRYLIDQYQLRSWALTYLCAPLLLLGGEALGRIVALLGQLFGQAWPPVHDAPLTSRSLTEFWGRRWNVWFSDWFRYALADRMKRRPVAATLLIFAVSGLMHEWVISLPLWWITGRALFGWQMLYFMLHALGVLIDRRWLRSNGVLRRAFLWLCVLGPLPLQLNEGLLRAFQLWPE